MMRHGALAAKMSGSGTAMFALCRNCEEANALAGQLKELNLGVTFATASR
jgi:4-diphosphocytidyl-2C-methyl-D-erythritol kinase